MLPAPVAACSWLASIPVEERGDALSDVGGEPCGFVRGAVAAEEPVEVGAGVLVGVLKPAGELTDQPCPFEQFGGRDADQLVGIVWD